ncbi:hypothetical protein Emag_002225 [Eimeria magna]
MAGRTPSNASPFSAELQTFVVTKYDPLLAIVRELNTRLQASEKERMRLERRVQRLESQLLSLSESFDKAGGGKLAAIELEGGPQTGKHASGGKGLACAALSAAAAAVAASAAARWFSLFAVRELLEPEEALVAPWLFSCQEDLWILLLEELPDEFAFRRPDSLQLLDLRRAAILAAALAEAWNRVEAGEPEALGRVAMVLDGTDIGTRLRAGKKRFRIEPLN